MNKWIKDTSYVGDLGKLRGLEDHGMTSVVSHFDNDNETIELCRSEYNNKCFFVKWNEEADKWELLIKIPEEILEQIDFKSENELSKTRKSKCSFGYISKCEHRYTCDGIPKQECHSIMKTASDHELLDALIISASINRNA